MSADNDQKPHGSERQEQTAQRLEESRRFEKRLFARLRELGILSIEVEFDGYGDSGQIGDITVRMNEETDDFASPSEPAFDGLSLYDAVETLIYERLELDHGAWELDLGSFGRYILNIRRDEVIHEFTRRVDSDGDHNGWVWPRPGSEKR